MSSDLNTNILAAYCANITVTFGSRPPFKGKVYAQGDGDHVLFCWPDQPNTKEMTELAEFKTQTKWVTTGGKCDESDFTEPDPNFGGMVSHEGYELISSDGKISQYLSSDGIRCTYNIDQEKRELVSTILFEGAIVEFENVEIGKQEDSLFVKPKCDSNN